MADDVSPPTLSEVVEKLQQLVSGHISREEASDWASPWITRFCEFEFGDPKTDRKIRNALDCLSGADTPSTDREYLFEKIDFEAWLQELTEDQ
jgi:uncharacterized protein YceH (UPF0502 family)